MNPIQNQPFQNIRPRSRTEREGMRDREAIEKQRLKDRVGGFHQYEDFKGVSAPAQQSSLYQADNERFDTDFASEDKRRREAERSRKQQIIGAHRNEIVGREMNRWDRMEQEDAKEAAKIQSMADKWQAGQKNNASVAYNPLTLQYDQNEQGRRLQQSDAKIIERADQRKAHLDNRMNGGFNILTGETRPSNPY